MQTRLGGSFFVLRLGRCDFGEICWWAFAALRVIGCEVFRRPRQIYGQYPQIHFEIVCDEANLKKIIGRAPGRRNSDVIQRNYSGQKEANG